MNNKYWNKFLNTGAINDYLSYKKTLKNNTEMGTDMKKSGEKNDSKRGNNSKNDKV